MNMQHYPAEDHVEIRDLGLASALVTIGCSVVSHRREVGGRVYFVFKNNQDLRAVVDAWNEHELEVNARIYFGTIKQLKDIIYSQRFS